MCGRARTYSKKKARSWALLEDDAVTRAQDLLNAVEARRIVVNDVSADLADLLDQEVEAASST